MSWFVSYLFGKTETQRLDMPCDPDDIDVFTQEKFRDIPATDLFTFQENGIWFCFHKKYLWDWVTTKENTNPMTRNPLSDTTLREIRKAVAPKLIYKLKFNLDFQSDKTSMNVKRCNVSSEDLRTQFQEQRDTIVPFMLNFPQILEKEPDFDGQILAVRSIQLQPGESFGTNVVDKVTVFLESSLDLATLQKLFSVQTVYDAKNPFWHKYKLWPVEHPVQKNLQCGHFYFVQVVVQPVYDYDSELMKAQTL